MPASLHDQLFQEIHRARQRVYELGHPTPLEHYPDAFAFDLFLKREDLSPIHAYKWRGAYNRMAALSEEERAKGVVSASAGNHAQGVALSARHLRTRASIYMPTSTPTMKQNEVRRLGGNAVDIFLVGDSYDDAKEAAHQEQESSGKTFIHPYDDLLVMGGQGTIADEVVMSGKGPFDVAFIQIGGGGMAAANACWLRTYYPNIRIVGVEGKDQASMLAAMEAGAPVRLEYLDVFCDGTAVRQVGEHTFPLCQELLDEIVTVSNEEVSAAIQTIWELARCVPEPSGAMGLAAALKMEADIAGQRTLVILCGANMDFHQLGTIAREADVGANRKRFIRVTINEGSGQMLHLLERFPEQVNISEFQYGKTNHRTAWPVVGFEGQPHQLEEALNILEQEGIVYTDVTQETDVEFRVIPFRNNLIQNPLFAVIEFHERAGALAGFLKAIESETSICYFNYEYTGERVGRAFMGFEFPSQSKQADFLKFLAALDPHIIRAFHSVSDEVMKRLV